MRLTALNCKLNHFSANRLTKIIKFNNVLMRKWRKLLFYSNAMIFKLSVY